jgi:hypothetical protein
VDEDDLVQAAERALFDAEQAYRADPSEARQRRVLRAWSEVRALRGQSVDEEDAPGFPFIDPRRRGGG